MGESAQDWQEVSARSCTVTAPAGFVLPQRHKRPHWQLDSWPSPASIREGVLAGDCLRAQQDLRAGVCAISAQQLGAPSDALRIAQPQFAGIACTWVASMASQISVAFAMLQQPIHMDDVPSPHNENNPSSHGLLSAAREANDSETSFFSHVGRQHSCQLSPEVGGSLITPPSCVNLVF